MSLYEDFEIQREQPLTSEQRSVLQDTARRITKIGLAKRYLEAGNIWLEFDEEFEIEDSLMQVEIGTDAEDIQHDHAYHAQKYEQRKAALACEALFAFGVENISEQGSRTAMLTVLKVDAETGSEIPFSTFAVGVLGDPRELNELYDGSGFDRDDEPFALSRIMQQRKVGLFYSKFSDEQTLGWAIASNSLLAEELIGVAASCQAMLAHVLSGENEWYSEWDAQNEQYLTRIIETYGWPTISHVGTEASHAASSIVLLAPNAEFTQRCLIEMKACDVGDVNPKDIAHLEDRVLVMTGRPQLYGTQYRQTDQAAILYPIRDPGQVDERRAKVGLGPIADYKLDMRLLFPK